MGRVEFSAPSHNRGYPGSRPIASAPGIDPKRRASGSDGSATHYQLARRRAKFVIRTAIVDVGRYQSVAHASAA